MIRADNLSKVYSNGKGIFNVGFTVEKGEAFGFLGPNGAGKTTAIRLLMGFTNPTDGKCSVNGLDSRSCSHEIQRTLGYVPGETAFLQGMTGRDFLKFMGDMRGKEQHQQEALIRLFELEVDRPIGKMSKGMKQKLALVTAFMHDPEILILDEPTSGLDPLMHRRFIDLILQKKEEGKTILMSSHRFDEVESTCSRAAIIKDGELVAVEDIGDLRASKRKRYLVTFATDEDMEKLRASGLEHSPTGPRQAQIWVRNEYDRMLNTLASCTVLDIKAPDDALEQHFIGYYGKGEGSDTSAL